MAILTLVVVDNLGLYNPPLIDPNHKTLPPDNLGLSDSVTSILRPFDPGIPCPYLPGIAIASDDLRSRVLESGESRLFVDDADDLRTRPDECR